MTHSNHRTRVMLGLSALMATVLLAACGGGAGGEPPITPPPPGPPPVVPAPVPSVSDFLTLGYSSRTGATGKTMLLVDPASAPPIRRSLTLPDEALRRSVAAQVYTIDPIAETGTLYGESMTFFVQNHQLFQVSLRKADSNLPQRISSMTTACSVNDWATFTPGATADGMVSVVEAGPDGNCATSADNRQMYVRAGAPVSAPALAYPTGVTPLAELPNEAHTGIVGILVRDARSSPSKLAVYSPSLTPVADVTGGANIYTFRLLGFVPGSGQSAGYVFVEGSLRRLTWSATGAALSAPLYNFVNHGPAGLGSPAVSDSSAVYFVDDLSVRRVLGSGTVELVGTLAAATGGALSLVGITDTRLLLQHRAATTAVQALYSLPKSGGGFLSLYQGGTWPPSVLGTRGETVAYTIPPSSGPANHELRLINANGTGSRILATQGCSAPFPVFGRTYRFAMPPALDGLVWVDPATGETDCRNGTVKSLDLSSGLATTLGTFAHFGVSSFSLKSGYGFADIPLVIQTEASLTSNFETRSDMYHVAPLQAGSLVRLSTQIP